MMAIVEKLMQTGSGNSAKVGSASLDDSSSGTDNHAELLAKSDARGLQDQRHIRERVQNAPLKVIKEFEKEIREKLGVSPRQGWTMKDWHKSGGFGS